MFLLISFKIIASFAVSCKDMKGNDVPWFLIIKPPSVTSQTRGQEFMYLDPSHLTAVLQPTLINDVGAISYTLNQINSKTVSSVV